MIIDIPYVNQRFSEFNSLIFDGKLPSIPVRLSEARSFLGRCQWERRKIDDGKWENHSFEFVFNNRIDFPESLIDDVIIHEMIHYYIAYMQLEDESAHGPLFLHMMNQINEKFGRHITVSHTYDKNESEQSYDKRPLWHIVAVVKLKGGGCGIKVIPRIKDRIVNYYNEIRKLPEIDSVELYRTNNPFFNRFPNSGKIGYHCLEEREVRENITGAEAIECDGVSIKRKR